MVWTLRTYGLALRYVQVELVELIEKYRILYTQFVGSINLRCD